MGLERAATGITVSGALPVVQRFCGWLTRIRVGVLVACVCVCLAVCVCVCACACVCVCACACAASSGLGYRQLGLSRRTLSMTTRFTSTRT